MCQNKGISLSWRRDFSVVEWRKKSSSFQGKEDPKKSLSSGKLRVGKFVCMGVTMYADTRAHRNNFTSNVYKIVFVCVCVHVWENSNTLLPCILLFSLFDVFSPQPLIVRMVCYNNYFVCIFEIRT